MPDPTTIAYPVILTTWALCLALLAYRLRTRDRHAVSRLILRYPTTWAGIRPMPAG
ncbi:hypothetical protein [Kitasatospora sp. NPDC094011]|uniref:hypothetical protein n=1 Tax=Kitasatospora sp. NPDC094011 TaxID=3364090 RepID=UPI003808C8B5